MKHHIRRPVSLRMQYRGPQATLTIPPYCLIWRIRQSRYISIISSGSWGAESSRRALLSRLWVPSGGITATKDEDAHSKLIRAGFLRQAHSGIFHMLPLGRRVQDKLEALIDKHMSKLTASKLALSSISSQELWARSGRLGSGAEIFCFEDRKDVGYLLAPTHEEEITSLVGSTVKSYKDLPVRLYQISRKYRDELRPRHGLLRSREFIMKDLYTFDCSISQALATYDEVRTIYAELFDELKLPYLVARADSGDMGGNLSHEFHFPTTLGEDNIISCSNDCGYVANEELATSPISTDLEAGDGVQVWRGVSRDRKTLINVWYPKSGTDRAVNIHAVKAVLPEVDLSIEEPLSLWFDKSALTDRRQLVNLIDGRLPESVSLKIQSNDVALPYWPAGERPSQVEIGAFYGSDLTQQPLNLLRILDGDACPECESTVKVQKAIELGHTFHLGTRYSEPLKATVTIPVELLEEGNASTIDLETSHSNSTRDIPMQMGCHGIGVSRIIGAVADTLADGKGLNWPRALAPYEIIIIPGKGLEEDALGVYDVLAQISGPTQRDLILDDRSVSFPWKMRDADLIGYPVIVVLGRRWRTERTCEIQCRRLGISKDVLLEKVPSVVDELLAQL